MSKVEQAAEALKKHGFQVQICKDAQAAKEAALALIKEGASVGFGGSVTVRDIGLYETLLQAGHPVYWHWKCEKEEVPAVHAAAQKADVYFCSANAVLKSGALLNIDGTGNRVSSLIYGPKRVVVIAGENKICENYEDGIDRIKREACPPNARRLGLNVPCAITGKCSDCNSPQRMCHITALLERPTNAVKDVHVLLVEESLGY